MKQIKVLIVALVIALLLSGSSPAQAALPADLNVVNDASHRDFHDLHDEATELAANLTAAGSSLTQIGEDDTFALPAATNVLLLPGTDAPFSASELTSISDWFASDGKKLLWVASDSDFKGFFNYSNIHAVLETVKSDLRFATISISDPTDNDGASYRPRAIGAPTDGKINSVVNVGVTSMIMHGPSAVVAMKGDTVVNPSEVSSVEVLRESGPNAESVDDDFSESNLDFYSGTGVVPMIAIQDMGNSHWVVISGEAVWSDYKFMYGTLTEGGLANDGQTFVDNLLTWFSANAETVTLRESSDDGFLPLSVVPIAIGFIALAIINKKRK